MAAKRDSLKSMILFVIVSVLILIVLLEYGSYNEYAGKAVSDIQVASSTSTSTSSISTTTATASDQRKNSLLLKTFQSNINKLESDMNRIISDLDKIEKSQDYFNQQQKETADSLARGVMEKTNGLNEMIMKPWYIPAFPANLLLAPEVIIKKYGEYNYYEFGPYYKPSEQQKITEFCDLYGAALSESLTVMLKSGQLKCGGLFNGEDLGFESDYQHCMEFESTGADGNNAINTCFKVSEGREEDLIKELKSICEKFNTAQKNDGVFNDENQEKEFDEEVKSVCSECKFSNFKIIIWDQAGDTDVIMEQPEGELNKKKVVGIVEEVLDRLKEYKDENN